ncbi:MAG: hypothetical protein LC791_10520 [Acidobacteria bacterium]|nr:hypothetical protein [Acidobacteriota bacterium]
MTRRLEARYLQCAARIHAALRDTIARRVIPSGRLSTVERVACAALLATALVSVSGWWTTLSRVAGGADSYGYVSESQLLRHGSLIDRPAADVLLPFDRPYALAVAAPLGYTASLSADGIVPIYPAGLPALMALATLVAGPDGPFYVAPIMGVIGLLIAFLLSRTWFDVLTSCLAVTFIAWNPLYVAYAKQPMSDVPAAVALMAAVWLVMRRQSRPMTAGLVAGAAFLIRPALAGGCAVLGLAALYRCGPRGALRYGATFAPAVLLQAVLHQVLYGHPLQSGYGSPATLFSWKMLPTNVVIYGHWLVLSHWETLRFVLPGLLVLTIVAASGVTRTFERWGSWVAVAGVVVCGAGVAYEASRWLERHGTWRLAQVEEKYPLLARWIAQSTAPDAVVMAFQHSGSIRYYAGRQTIRWDALRSEDLIPAVRHFQARGVSVFAVLEGVELGQFQDRFRSELDRVDLLPAGQARGVIVVELRVRASG